MGPKIDWAPKTKDAINENKKLFYKKGVLGP